MQSFSFNTTLMLWFEKYLLSCQWLSAVTGGDRKLTVKLMIVEVPQVGGSKICKWRQTSCFTIRGAFCRIVTAVLVKTFITDLLHSLPK